jgi:transcriptional regulator with XRE-family HTH domain
MKQPELGKKLIELRKAKGLTQEELVERCNISVRTIQRIESGDVTPRSYTVKTILAALGYNFDDVFVEENLKHGTGEEEDRETDSDHPKVSVQTAPSTSGLSVSLGAGLIYFLLTFPEAIIEYVRFSEGTLLVGTTWYIIMKVVLVAAFTVFQVGFIRIGQYYGNYLLRIAAVIHIAILAGISVYEIASIENPDNKIVVAPAAMLFGGIGVLYGGALLKLREKLGRTALAAGALEVVAGFLFITVVLYPFADVITMFAELLELVLLYKVIDIIRRSQKIQGPLL